MKVVLGLVVVLAVVWFVLQPRSEWPITAPSYSDITSGKCKAVRKQKGMVLWQCGEEQQWLEAYLHRDMQGDWQEPEGCVIAVPVGVKNPTHKYKTCPDGQSFWVYP